MAYSDFTLKKIKQELAIQVIEDKDLFSQMPDVQVSDYLLTTLAYNLPLAMAISTEKARSELIIAQVLLEVRRQLHNQYFGQFLKMALREQQGLMLPEPELNQTQVKCRVAKNTNTLINKNILSIGF